MRRRLHIAVLGIVLLSLVMLPLGVDAFDLESRMAGQNRYETSALVAKEVFEQSDTVIIARGDVNNDFADGLTASVLAGALQSPVLLTDKDELPPSVGRAIQQLGAKKAYILGGKEAISSKVEQQVKGLVSQVKRIQGETRFETAANILREAGIKSKSALIVNGYQSADAMVAGSVAYANQWPILPVQKDQIPELTQSSLDRLGIEQAYLIGGTEVISKRVENELTKQGITVTRVAGDNRYATSIEAATTFFERPTGMIVVNGQALADAVGAAVYGQPILYTAVDKPGKALEEWVRQEAGQGRLGWMVLVGGEQVIHEQVRQRLSQIAEEAAGDDEGFWFRSTQVSHATVERAELNLNNQLFVSAQFEPYAFRGELSWKEDPYDNRTWQLSLHSLDHVSYLVDGYVLTGEVKYLEKAQWYVDSWVKHNGDPRQAASSMAWNNHAVANRLITLTYFWQKWRTSPLHQSAKADELMELMHSHAVYLADDKNYSHFNYGIFQDKALLQFVTLFPWIDPKDEWRDKALNRLNRRLSDDLTLEGVHKEHSPNYHLLFYNQFKELERFAQEHDIPFPDLTAKMNQMEYYLAAITKPNGELPLLGDTPSMELSRRMDAAQVSDELAYVLTRGAQGKAPEELDQVFPEGGTAVMRSSWEMDEAVYLLFTAAFHSTIHKHADDLSFVLSHGWTDYFVDSGMYNYEEDNPYRQYMRSVFAHNTLAVEGESYPLSNDQAGRSKIINYHLGETYSYVTAEHKLYPAVTVTRTIIHVKPGTFFILDRVRGFKTREISQMFQIGPEVDVLEANEEGLRLESRLDDSQLVLRQLTPAERVETYHGQTNPVRGFRSTKFNELAPNASVHFVQTAREAEFQTLLYINQTNVTDVQVDGNVVRLTMNNGQVIEVNLN
jgi:putative cell wall-binding protein